MPDLTSDYALATSTAETTLNQEIKAFVPPWAQDKIPADLIHKAATEIGKNVVDALQAAHPWSPST